MRELEGMGREGMYDENGKCVYADVTWSSYKPSSGQNTLKTLLRDKPRETFN